MWREPLVTHANDMWDSQKQLPQKCASSSLKYRSKKDTCHPMTDEKCLMHVCTRKCYDAATIDCVKHTSLLDTQTLTAPEKHFLSTTTHSHTRAHPSEWICLWTFRNWSPKSPNNRWRKNAPLLWSTRARDKKNVPKSQTTSPSIR